MRPSKISRRLSLHCIIPFYGSKRLLRLLFGREGMGPPASRNELSKSGILDDDRARSGEVASRSAAKPAGAEGDINVLSHRNLPARADDIILIVGRGQGDGGTVHHSPTVGR